jgi:serine/threonine protein kinase
VIAVKKAKDNESLAHFFDKEADNLEKLQKYNSPHLIKPIAAYQINQDRCLIFPWASGGNLGDFWRNYEGKSREINSLQWIVRQLLGISSALDELHQSNCRHGDLKPENILWFKDSIGMGTLQIADLGLARFHEEEAHTNVRQKNDMHTSTPSGTSRYEPPETDKDRATKETRSRQYDIWSMGCIVLELLIWLTYGYQAVEKFKNNTRYFWELQQQNRYVVHPYVVSRMRIMDTKLQENTAYKELLHLVRDRFLIVKVSETYKSQPEFREIAKVLCASIRKIQEKCLSKPSYLAPVTLEYSSDEIIVNVPQPGIVYQNEVGLATPPRRDVPRSPQTSLSSRISDPEGDAGPLVILRAPTFPTLEIKSDSSRREMPRILDDQEVGELDHLRNMNLQG